MSKILNAVKEKLNRLRHKTSLRIVLVSVLALLLILSATYAWYINNLSILGMEFNTGNIDFNAYVYSANGTHLLGPVESNEENETKYMNAPLITINDAEVGTVATAYIVVESTGSIGMQYRMAFDITGKNESSTAYLGGYKYKITKVTDKVVFSGSGNLNVSGCPAPGEINDEVVTIDRNAVDGTIAQKNGYEVFRFDYKLVEKNKEYTGNSINIYFNIFATQIDGDFEEVQERGRTYFCSSREDIDRAKVEAYPGDTIKLSSDIVYYGDLVFNKPINLETNDFTLTVNGNLMYDYVLTNRLKIDAGGLGKIVVQCTKEGIGGNFQIKAPIGEVTLLGANASTGDIVVEKSVIIDATKSDGSAGVSFNEVRIVDLKNARKTIQLESNTRATVSFGTTIGAIQSVVKASNIEIINNGVIGEINLSNMSKLAQTNSPQIYILNNSEITKPIILPSWSEKFIVNANGTCTGNTKIEQSYSGSYTEVTGSSKFDNSDIDVERKEFLVEQIEEGDDSRLKIYYQDLEGQTTTIQSILENYLKNEAVTGCTVNEVVQLQIISIDNKPVTNADLKYLNSDTMLALTQLDLQRATIYDKDKDAYHRLPNRAFYGISKYKELILPRNLLEIGSNAFENCTVENIVTIPSGVTTFGTNWFNNGNYVYFAASVPIAEATNGLTNVKAIFVDEAYIGSYKSVYSTHSTRIYPISVLDETKTHFVRNTNSDEWEITYYISGEDAVIGENITIDGTILKITSVYDYAYTHNFTGTKVKFADTVENLGAGNFAKNKNITEVDLNNLKYIGDDAFVEASALAKAVFGNYLETIGARAFMDCVSLNQEVALPSTMQSIGISAFRKTKITGLNTDGTTSIGGQAFFACADLVYADMPKVQVIAESGTNYAFQECTSLVSVKMQSLIKVGGYGLFNKCLAIREVYLGTNDDSLTLGNSPFSVSVMAKLKLYVPEEYLEFYRSKLPGGIEEAKIYPQGEKMGTELVNDYNIGTYIVANNGDGTYALITSNIDYTDTLEIPKAFNGKKITHIYDNAFRNQSITNVTLKLGDDIRSIGSKAFYQCSGLVKVEFGSALQIIGPSAFAFCTNLKQDISLPASMQRIEKEAFNGSGILGINTGGTLSVDTRAFMNCTSMSYAVMPEVTTIAESGTNDVFVGCIYLVSVDMPKLTKVYGMRLFMSCSSLLEIYLGTNDANITLGSSPFYGLDTSKIKLFVPEALVLFYQERGILDRKQVYPRGEKLGDKEVNGYTVGDYVVIENEDGYTLVTSHLDFEGRVVVPNEYNGKSITAIYANALRNQTFTDATLVLGNSITSIGSSAFYGVKGLNAVVMDQVTTIGADAFYGSSIEVLNAPKLTQIGGRAFSKCASLETVSIPKVVTIESASVFAECASLKSVYFESIMTLETTTFNLDKSLEKITINRIINANGSNMPAVMTIEATAPCKIYVPYQSLSAYTTTWSGKPVVSFDISASHNGNTYILTGKNGKYTLIDFSPASSMTSLTIPTTVYSQQLGNISINAISSGAFSALSQSLQSLTLSSTITQLNGSALSECAALTNIYVSSSNVYFVSVNGVLYSKDAKMLVKYPAGRSGAFDMTAASYASTVGIGASAFANAANLTQIVFPASLKVIDSTSFTNCKSLRTVQFTGNTPPILMGAEIFDTSVEGFTMIIPTADSNVVNAYLCAYNFGEYEPYIVLNGNTAPGADAPHNQVPTAGQNTPDTPSEQPILDGDTQRDNGSISTEEDSSDEESDNSTVVGDGGTSDEDSDSEGAEEASDGEESDEDPGSEVPDGE